MTAPRTVMCVQVDAAADQPRVVWMDAAQVAEQHGIAEARAQLGRLVDGAVWNRPLSEGSVELLSCPEHLRETLSEQVRQMMLSGGADAITKLKSRDKSLLARTTAEPVVLATLAQDRRSPRVRQTVANNRATPDFVLDMLLDDADEQVRLAALSNDNLSGSTLTRATDSILAAEQVLLMERLASRSNLEAGSCVKLIDWLVARPYDVPYPEYHSDALSRLLEHPNTPDAVAEQVIETHLTIENASHWKLKALAGCVRMPPVKLRELAARSRPLEFRVMVTLRRQAELVG